MTTHEQQKVAALKAVCDMLIEAVAEGGTMGVPGGILYAVLMEKITLRQFEALMSAIVEAGRLTKRGDLYFAE